MPAPRQFPPDVAMARRRERRDRHKRQEILIAQWFRSHHPRLYNKALLEVAEQINQERGPLPGEKPQ